MGRWRPGLVWVRVLAPCLCLGALGASGCGRAKGQPLAFDHRLHADNNVSCTVCHPTAADGVGASLPAVSTCRRCHEDILYESPEERKIQLALEARREIAWEPVYALRRHVYFSHRRHVELGKIDCGACHGAVELRTAPFLSTESPFAGRRGMTACIRCHEESHSRYAGIDCLDCHR